MKPNLNSIYLFLLLTVLLSSCSDILKDTDLNPVYFLECDINGEKFRAQTNNNAWMGWVGITEGEYYVIGQNVSTDMQVDLTLFEQLGENKINAGTLVGTYFTNIVYFNDDKTYSAFTSGGDGCVIVEFLSDTETRGTFEATLVDTKDASNIKEVTNGKFKVKTR